LLLKNTHYILYEENADPNKDVRGQHAVDEIVHGAWVTQHVNMKPWQHHLARHQGKEVVHQPVLFSW